MSQTYHKLDSVNKVLAKWIFGRIFSQVHFLCTGSSILVFQPDPEESSSYSRDSTVYLRIDGFCEVTSSLLNSVDVKLSSGNFVNGSSADLCKQVLMLYLLCPSIVTNAKAEADGSLSLVLDNVNVLRVNPDPIRVDDEMPSWILHFEQGGAFFPEMGERIEGGLPNCPFAAINDSSRVAIFEA